MRNSDDRALIHAILTAPPPIEYVMESMLPSVPPPVMVELVYRQERELPVAPMGRMYIPDEPRQGARGGTDKARAAAKAGRKANRRRVTRARNS